MADVEDRHLDARTVEARHKQIELDRVQVMFRNKTSRILHFENADRSIRVKHVGASLFTIY